MRAKAFSSIAVFTLLAALCTSFAAVIITGRTVNTTMFNIVWDSGRDVEAITSLQWKGGPNLVGAFAIDTCAKGDVEYFGNAWAPPDPQAGGVVLVGGPTANGVWAGDAKDGAVGINGSSALCNTITNILPVSTKYTFEDSSTPNQFRVERTFDFSSGFRHPLRPYIPRLSLGMGFTHVLYPTVSGTLATKDSRDCPFGCTGPQPAPGAASLAPLWDGTLAWYAIHNPTTGQGMIVFRRKTFDSRGVMMPVQLWIDNDDASNTNATSFLLMKPAGGFVGQLLETETFCFYDQSSWTPSLTPPTECQPQGGDWPQSAHDPAHTGYNPTESVIGVSNVGELGLQWTASDGSITPPVVANGIEYLVSGGQSLTVLAFDSSTGRPLWTFPLDAVCSPDTGNSGLSLTPAVDNGLLYTSCGSSWVHYYVIDAKSGALVFDSIDFLKGPWTIADGNIFYAGWQYISGPDWFFYFEREAGCGGFVEMCYPASLLSVASGNVYSVFAVSDLTPPYACSYIGVIAVNEQDGSRVWSTQVGKPPKVCGWYRSPVVADGVVYVALDDGNLYAFDAQTGTALWVTRTAVASMVAADRVVYVGTGSHLSALNASNSARRWTILSNGLPLAVANGVLYTDRGAFNAKTGALLWTGVGSAVSYGTLYSLDGSAYSLPK
jgi:outer membrane protein assembly factor BamB